MNAGSKIRGSIALLPDNRVLECRIAQSIIGKVLPSSAWAAGVAGTIRTALVSYEILKPGAEVISRGVVGGLQSMSAVGGHGIAARIPTDLCNRVLLGPKIVEVNSICCRTSSARTFNHAVGRSQRYDRHGLMMAAKHCRMTVVVGGAFFDSPKPSFNWPVASVSGDFSARLPPK